MASRQKLHEELCNILGSRFVYFQPPESVKLQYPCIVYSLSDINIKNADNLNYIRTRQYSIKYISRDAGNTTIDKMLDTFNHCSFNRRYTADNLYHDLFTLYY